jgi:hypothetical protein
MPDPAEALDDASRALLRAIVASRRESVPKPELLRAGHAAGTIAALWEAGWVATFEDAEGVMLPGGTRVTLTPLAAFRLGVRLEEVRADGKPEWVAAHWPGPDSVRLTPADRFRTFDVLPLWIDLMVHRRMVERHKAEAHFRALLRQAEEDRFLIDPRTNQPAELWGVKLGAKARRVGTAPKQGRPS